MLINLLIYIYIAFFAYTYGLLFKSITRIKNKEKFTITCTSNFFSTTISGLCLLMLILGYYSIFLPINGITHSILLIIALLFWFTNKSFFKIQLKNLAFLKMNFIQSTITILFLLIILICSSSLILWHAYDTGLYHAKFVTWISEFRAIKGLGNIDGRLAFNSHFYLLTAFFSLNFFQAQVFFALNGFFSIFLLFFFLHTSLKNKINSSPLNHFGIYAIILSLYFSAFKFQIYSQYADISSVVLVLYVFIKLLERIKAWEINKFDLNFYSIMLVCFSAPLLKLSSAFMLLIPLYFASKMLWQKNINNFCKLSLLGTIVLAPWLIRNTILSGYLIYPFPSLDIFSFDWKIPLSKAIAEKNITENFARFVGTHSDSVFGFSQWFPVWWHKTETLSFVLLCLIASSILVLLYAKLSSKKVKPEFFHLFLLFLCGVVYTHFQAPSVRFVFAPSMACVGIAYFIFTEELCSSKLKKNINNVLIALCLVIGVQQLRDPLYLVKQGQEIKLNHFLVPENYPLVKTTSKRINNIDIVVPTNGNQCWNENCLCIDPRFLDKNICLRGKSIIDGFRINHPNFK